MKNPIKVVVQKTRSMKKISFSMILRLEMILSVVFYVQKHIFDAKNSKLTKNNIFDNVFL